MFQVESPSLVEICLAPCHCGWTLYAGAQPQEQLKGAACSLPRLLTLGRGISARPGQTCFFLTRLWAWPKGPQMRWPWLRKIKMRVYLEPLFPVKPPLSKFLPLVIPCSWHSFVPVFFQEPWSTSFLAFHVNQIVLLIWMGTPLAQNGFLPFPKLRSPNSSLVMRL